jgi:hypothetical protein
MEFCTSTLVRLAAIDHFHPLLSITAAWYPERDPIPFRVRKWLIKIEYRVLAGEGGCELHAPYTIIKNTSMIHPAP